MGEQWAFFVALMGLVAAWQVISFGLLRSYLGKCMKDMETKVGDIGKAYQNVEREMLQLKADLPLSYVRREDFIRQELTINAKLDRLHDLIEKKWGGLINAGNRP